MDPVDYIVFLVIAAFLESYPARESVKNQGGIPTNGAYITVNENERLQAADVKAILEAFVHCKPRPSTFAWREITDQFR